MVEAGEEEMGLGLDTLVLQNWGAGRGGGEGRKGHSGRIEMQARSTGRVEVQVSKCIFTWI